jgi:hypothetical protein
MQFFLLSYLLDDPYLNTFLVPGAHKKEVSMLANKAKFKVDLDLTFFQMLGIKKQECSWSGR